MNTRLILITVLLALAVADAFALKGDEDAASQGWAMIEDGALLIDVRTPEEFAQGHIQGAVNAPHTDTERLLEAAGDDPERQIVVYCGSGRRAGLAKDTLEANGFDRVFNATGYDALVATKP